MLYLMKKDLYKIKKILYDILQKERSFEKW